MTNETRLSSYWLEAWKQALILKAGGHNIVVPGGVPLEEIAEKETFQAVEDEIDREIAKRNEVVIFEN